MQARRTLDHHAAVIIVAGDLLALLPARHHVRAGLRGVVEPGEALLLRGEVLRGPGTDKAAALLPEAVDRLLGDQPLDQREGIGRIRQQPLGAVRRDRGGAAGKALADIDPAADRAAIPGAGADAERPCSSTTASTPCLANSSAAATPA
jgi:hypothetical protein